MPIRTKQHKMKLRFFGLWNLIKGLRSRKKMKPQTQRKSKLVEYVQFLNCPSPYDDDSVHLLSSTTTTTTPTTESKSTKNNPNSGLHGADNTSHWIRTNESVPKKNSDIGNVQSSLGMYENSTTRQQKKQIVRKSMNSSETTPFFRHISKDKHIFSKIDDDNHSITFESDSVRLLPRNNKTNGCDEKSRSLFVSIKNALLFTSLRSENNHSSPKSAEKGVDDDRSLTMMNWYLPDSPTSQTTHSSAITNTPEKDRNYENVAILSDEDESNNQYPSVSFCFSNSFVSKSFDEINWSFIQNDDDVIMDDGDDSGIVTDDIYCDDSTTNIDMDQSVSTMRIVSLWTTSPTSCNILKHNKVRGDPAPSDEEECR